MWNKLTNLKLRQYLQENILYRVVRTVKTQECDREYAIQRRALDNHHRNTNILPRVLSPKCGDNLAAFKKQARDNHDCDDDVKGQREREEG